MPWPVDPAYVWGDALSVLDDVRDVVERHSARLGGHGHEAASASACRPRGAHGRRSRRARTCREDPRCVEVYRGKLILYGCGDFLDDYEGIGGYEGFRGDLVLMYLPTLDGSTGCLKQLRLVPMRLRRMRLCRPSGADLNRVRTSLDRMCEGFGTRLDPEVADGFALRRAP